MTTVEEIRLKAKAILEPSLEKFISGDANPQTHSNVAAFQNYLIRPYAICNTTKINLSTTMLGHHVDLPVCIAPMGRQHAIDHRGEHVLATAAKKCEVGFTMSAWASVTMEDLVMNSSTGLKFLNIYIYKNRSWTEHLVRRAEQCGFQGFVLGLAKMNPAQGSTMRVANLQKLVPSNIKPTDPYYPMPDDATSWSDVVWLKSITKLPIIVKGMLSARDAIQAVNAGVDAIIVSNHGGRQLPGVVTPIDVLPEIAAAVGKRCEVYMDGGVRNGIDIFKALALGAKAVFIGRPMLWGMACDGIDGVTQVLDIYKRELTHTMRLAGAADVNKIPGDIVIRKELIARL